MKALFLGALALISHQANATTQYGLKFSAENIYFLSEKENLNEDNSSSSFTLTPKLNISKDHGRRLFRAELFSRFDANDERRSHTDLREFSWTHQLGNIEYKVGVSKEFWGVVESYRLVDIINQVDNVEDVEQSQRLGQAMLKFSYLTDHGTYSAWVLPQFRERNFISSTGRIFSGNTEIKENKARFESSEKEKHVDFALRYSHAFGDFDLGLSYFQGTKRSPELEYDQNLNALIPFYDQTKMSAIDLQWTGDALLLKLEGLHREDKNEGTSNAAVYGFEYTFFNLIKSHDLGFIMEHIYDDRGFDKTSFDNDLFTGFRYTLNDLDATEFLAGGFFDLKRSTQVLRLKAKSRLNKNWSLEAIGQGFIKVADKDLFYKEIENDDYLRLNLIFNL